MRISANQLWRLIKQSTSAWMEDRAMSMGAAIAFYTIFSLAPLLLIIIALAALVFGEEAARGAVVQEVGGMVGETGAQGVQTVLEGARDTGRGVFATLASLVTLAIGATTVFAELQSSLDKIWKAPPSTQASGIWGFLRTRLLSFGMVLGIGFLLIISLVVSAALSALGNWIGGWLTWAQVIMQVLNFLVSFAVITALFAMIYKILPSVELDWDDVWIGAAATSLLFSIGKFLIGLYIGQTALASSFGAAGTFVVLIIWVYYSTSIFLLGAEFTYAYAYEQGSRSPGRARQPQGAPAGMPGFDRRKTPERRRRPGAATA